MKVLMTVTKDENIIRCDLLPAAGAMVEALVEIQKGYTVALSAIDDTQELPKGFVFDTRIHPTIN